MTRDTISQIRGVAEKILVYLYNILTLKYTYILTKYNYLTGGPSAWKGPFHPKAGGTH